MPPNLSFLRGFRFGAAKAGLKKSGRTDFALIVADAPASAAAAFTANRVTAAPLIVDKKHLRSPAARCAPWPSTPATPTAPPARPAWTPLAPPAPPCAADLRLPAGRGLSLLHRRYRRSAAGGEAHCRRSARSGRPAGRGFRPLPAGGAGDPDHRHGGEDGLCAAGDRRERKFASPPSARARG